MIILTGGAGFIGSVILAELNSRGINDITVVDHLHSSDKWMNLVHKRFTNYYERSDFLALLSSDPKKFEKVTAIIHIGACSSTTERDVDFLMRNNVHYSQALANFAKTRGIRFIYASSAATYGLGEVGYNDATPSHELRPLNAYGFSKNVFDAWLDEQYGFSWGAVGLKFFNVYGPNEYHKGPMASMIYKAFHQISTTGKMRLFKSTVPEYADGEQQRDFIYVKDCATMVCELLTAKKSVCGVLNCGTGEARSWNDLARATFAALNTPAAIEYIEMPQELSKQYQNFTRANIHKAQSNGLLQNLSSLENGIKDYVTNYLALQKFL